MKELFIAIILGTININIAIFFAAYGIGMAINNLAKVIKEKDNE